MEFKEGDKVYYDDGEVGVITKVLIWGCEVEVGGESAWVHPHDIELLNDRNGKK